jgi:hypothetical protein
MNPLFLQLIIKEKLKQINEDKKKETMMRIENKTKFPFSFFTIIRLTILFIILYFLDSNGWFIWWGRLQGFILTHSFLPEFYLLFIFSLLSGWFASGSGQSSELSAVKIYQINNMKSIYVFLWKTAYLMLFFIFMHVPTAHECFLSTKVCSYGLANKSFRIHQLDITHKNNLYIKYQLNIKRLSDNSILNKQTWKNVI